MVTEPIATAFNTKYHEKVDFKTLYSTTKENTKKDPIFPVQFGINKHLQIFQIFRLIALEVICIGNHKVSSSIWN